MIFLLVVIGFATSTHTGWHGSIHRVGLDRCNAIKSKMQQSVFCGLKNFECETQQGFEIVGADSEYLGQFKANPYIEAHGDWVTYVKRRGLTITQPPTSQCDIFRLSAVVGAPWDTLEKPPRNTISIKVDGMPHKAIVGNFIYALPVEDGRTLIHLTWETMTELYIVVQESTIELSIQVDDPWNFFSANMMGFHHVRQEIRESVSDGTVILATEPFFFAESLTNGFVKSVTAKCSDDTRGSNTLREEILTPNEQGEYVASCNGGYRYPKFSMRKYTSKKSAIAVCVENDDLTGDGAKPYSEILVTHGSASNLCQSRGMKLPTLRQVRSNAFCDQIYPFGHFYYMWVRNTENEEPVDVETTDDMIPHAETFEDNVDQSSLIVEVNAMTVAGSDEISDVFPQLMNSNEKWGVIAEYTYPKDCHVLETKVEYEPLDANSEVMEGVSHWIVTRRNGVWTYGEFYSSSARGREGELFAPAKLRDGMLSFANQWKRRPDERRIEVSINDHQTFVDYGEINHISGNTISNPFLAPRGLNLQGDVRERRFYAVQRGFLAVKTVSQCSFKLATSLWKQTLTMFGIGANIHPGSTPEKQAVTSRIRNLQTFKDSVADTTGMREVTLVPGRFYYLEVRMVDVTYKWHIAADFKMISLLWDCGEGLQVVPRLNLFSIGNTEEEIISDKVHINVVKTAEFSIALTSPPAVGTTVNVICTGPASLVITPSVLPFTSSDWTDMRVVTVSSSVSHFDHRLNPDSFIQCTSADLRPVSISVTLGPNNPQHFQVSPSGYYANWYKNEGTWTVRDVHLAPGNEPGCVYNLLQYSDDKFSFYIQTKHDSAEAYDINIGPLVGVAFAYGPFVFAAYTSVRTDGWKVYRLSGSAPGGPKISRVSLDDPINPGKMTVEFPCGSVCQVIPHGDHFMHLSCIIAGTYTGDLERPTCLSPGSSFFKHPNGGTIKLVRQEAVPAWPAGSPFNDQVWATVMPPAVMEGKILSFPEDGKKMSADEVSAFKEWETSLREVSVDFSAPRAWNEVQSKCPLMSDKIFNALRPFVSSSVSAWVSEIELRNFITSLLRRCHADYFMQKFLSCLGPYEFNEDDAVQSLRSIVYYFVSFSRVVSDNIEMVGRGLTLLADNGMPGHLCSRRGHLVGSPPVCACIGNVGSGNVYPNCPDTIDCPPATQWQLDMMGALAYPGVPGTDFCSAEKSIVIVRSLGVSINCFRGFCYYWSSPKVRNGLKYEMCITPYCVTGYTIRSDGVIVWYGLTECGQTVISSDNGDTWSISGTSLPNDTPQEQLATSVGTQPVRVALAGQEYYEVAAASIVRAGASSGKMVTVSMKWWCECIDPDTWNLAI